MLYCPLGVNITMSFIAAAGAVIFRVIWYSLIFHTSWMQALGKTREQLGNPWVGTSVLFVAMSTAAISLSLLMVFLNVGLVTGGLKLGVLVGIGFIALPMLASDIFEKRPAKLFFINAGYYVITVILMSMLLAYYR